MPFRLLIVDDNPEVRIAFRRVLAKMDCVIDEAGDGAEGLARVEAGRYDLVVLDIVMPHLDGGTMLGRLRARGDRTPVILLSSESRRSIIAGFMKLGIVDYVLKPFNPVALRSKVARALGIPPPPPDRSLAVDVLLVDDMPLTASQLEALLPPQVSLVSCPGAEEAIEMCHGHTFRVVLLDIPGVEDSSLREAVTTLQPDARLIALAMRGGPDLTGFARSSGYAGVLYKPLEEIEVRAQLPMLFGADPSAREP